MTKVIDKGLTPEAIEVLKNYKREDHSYVTWHLITGYSIDLYRYIHEDNSMLIEVIEGIIPLEDTIEIYRSLAHSLFFAYDSNYNWKIDLVYDDNVGFDDLILN